MQRYELFLNYKVFFYHTALSYLPVSPNPFKKRESLSL